MIVRWQLWLALKLVPLHYQIQLVVEDSLNKAVVISFKISIFALSNTTDKWTDEIGLALWLALKLVSLHYQIQPPALSQSQQRCCD